MNTTRTTSFYLKRITGLILLLALSAVFLFSAGAKLWFIQPFEWSFADILPVDMMTAGILARLFIGLEIVIGLFLLAHIFLKKFTYKASLSVLIFFTIYLVLLIIKNGNSGSCGCFGEAYQMKPLTAIWKNLAMIAATAALFFLYPVKAYKGSVIVALILTAASFITPFVTNPMYISGDGKPANRAINLDPLYKYGTPVPPIDLRKGRHVLVFMSLTCPHCRKAGYFIQVMHRQNPDLPFYAILGGHPDNQKDFFAETQSENLPHALITDGHAFSSMAGDAVPAIYYVNNGMIEREFRFHELDPVKIRKWMK